MNKDKIRYYWENGLLDSWCFNNDIDGLLDETYVREFWDNILNFRKLFQSKQFSEDFLREFVVPAKKFSNRWEWMELHQHLSERFIEEFENKWNWDHIFMYQDVSDEFIRKHKDRVSDFVMNETDIGCYL